MKSYTQLPHVADIRLKVQADTLPELFEAALEGMNNILKNKFSCQKHQCLFLQTIEIKTSDPTSLLIDFLSEVLTLSYENRVIFCQVKFTKFSQNYLKVSLFGAKTDRFNEDIKAVTYHEAEIKKVDNQFQTIIVFDI